MFGYIIRRLIQTIPVLVGITVISFTMIHIAPGSPIGQALDPKVPKKVVEQWEKNFHLNEPLPVQYWLWLKDLAAGDLKSFKDGRPVLKKILERLPATIWLNLVATLISFAIAIPMGIFSATHRYSPADHVFTFFAFVGISVPSFWLAYMLILLLVQGFGIPVLGVQTFGLVPLPPLSGLADRAWHLFLPAVIFAVGEIAVLSRYMRGSMLEVVREDYIRTAKAKGLTEDQVNYRHALRNALLPIVTIFGFLIPSLIGGSVIIESIFAWPGIGQLGYQSVLSRDYPTIMTLNTIAAFLVLLGNLVADVLYAWVDPRISYA
ncbi:MAG: ABC transporter permease [Candidatus Tectomicrobia bacterium]|uniref:ABC transporter permease n=1 Tax=Tectimicrobiota bacterium TaxID=2528274 RepID=A0A932GNY9_UNCTE|nr:ABC transporter permease [Candidatus Tectomicrobia bacterium]